MQPTIVDMTTLSQAQRLEAATILRTALAWADDAYGAPGEAEAEVAATIESEDRHGLAALEGERVLGWIGAIESYSHAWELHPLVVMPGRQRQGARLDLLQGGAVAGQLLQALRRRGHAFVGDIVGAARIAVYIPDRKAQAAGQQQRRHREIFIVIDGHRR